LFLLLIAVLLWLFPDGYGEWRTGRVRLLRLPMERHTGAVLTQKRIKPR
jgi:hypothetical protein